MERQKFVRLFGLNEIHLTACAVIKKLSIDYLLKLSELGAGYFEEPNQFWNRDPNHERALLKVYKRDPEEDSTYWDPVVQIVKIPMPFLGHDSSDGWGELQFLIKKPAAVKLARNRSFDTRVNQWVKETKPIQPKADFGTHVYLTLRFYHQNYLPPVPSDWNFEPVYVSVVSAMICLFYKIDVLWENEEIKITTAILSEDSPEIPKYL